MQKLASRPILVQGLRHYFNQASLAQMAEWVSEDQKNRGLNTKSAKIISIYFNEELNQKVNKNNINATASTTTTTNNNNNFNSNNNNSSNSLVFGQWPHFFQY